MRLSKRARVLAGLGAFLGVLVLSLFIIDLGGVVRGPLLSALSAPAAELGLQVGVGSLRLTLLPRPRLHAADLRLGVEGEAGPPLLTAAALEAEVALWPLVRSLRDEVRVERLALRGPALHLVRSAAGRLSVQPVLDRLARRPRRELDQEALDRLRRVALAQVSISEGAARFEEQGSGQSLAVSQLQIDATDVAIGAAPQVRVQAAVQSPGRNLEAQVALALIPAELRVLQGAAAGVPLWPLKQVRARLAEVSLDPLLPLLPAVRGLRLAKASGQLEVDGELDPIRGAARLRLAAGLRGATIGESSGRQALGRPQDVSVRAEGEVGLRQGTARISTLVVELTSEKAQQKMRVDGGLEVSGLPGAAKVERLSLQGGGLTLEGLLSILPPGTLPADEVLRGPLRLRAEQDPEEARLDLDMSGATIATASLSKAAGSALVLSLVGRLKPALRTDLQIELGSARLRQVSFKGEILNPLLSKLVERMQRRQPPAPRETAIQKLRARVALRGGRLHLREDAPLRVQTEEAALRFAGSIGLDGGLALDGQIDIEPAAIQAATRGRLRPQREIPVLVRVTGTRDAPRIEFVDLQRTLAALRPGGPGLGPGPGDGPLRRRLREDKPPRLRPGAGPAGLPPGPGLLRQRRRR
jgi:hypothetical protein